MNVFAKAQAAAPAAKKTKKDDKVVVTIAGLEELAAIDAAMKSLKAIRETLESDVKTAMKDQFVNTGIKAGKRPENFKGNEGIASASCELRARASNSPLSADEVALLAKYEIPTQTVDTVTETFIINPKYLNDSALLEKVGNAIGKIKDVPEDFIQKQNAVSKTIVAEGALDVLFAKNDANLVSTLLGTVGVLALKPTIGDKVKEAMSLVSKLLFGKDETQQAA
jgi:hypothetical protein